MVRLIGDMAEEVFKELVAHARYLRAGVDRISKSILMFIFAKPWVSKDGEEGVKELRKEAHSAGVWHTVQHADPGHEELTDKPIDKEENEGRTFNFPS